MEPILEEWEVTLIIRADASNPFQKSPDDWDFTDLLDLNTGIGEQAWVRKSVILQTGTEAELDGEDEITREGKAMAEGGLI
jgi:hypothetical protein